jgi:hypothetical protein
LGGDSTKSHLGPHLAEARPCIASSGSGAGLTRCCQATQQLVTDGVGIVDIPACRRTAGVQCSVRWPELTVAIEDFRVVRRRTLDIAAGISEEQAGKRLGTGTWSGAEVLDHLLRTELVFRKYQRQAMERAWAGARGTIRIGFREVDTRLRPLPSSWMPMLAPVLFGLHAVTPFGFRLAVMRRPGLVWAAAPKVAEPRRARALDELRADLGAQPRETAALFEGDLPEALPRVRVAHPLYGSNNALQMVRLMGAHEERHQHQLRAILKGP